MSYLIKSLVITLSLLITTTAFAGNTSYYGNKFHGKRTASGSIFNMNSLTAAHKTLPFGTKVQVTNQKTKQSVIVKITDRGPFIRGRILDLSKAAAGQINCQLCTTTMEILSYGDGKYRRE
ncbi:septal ring lytic transglycosylase RlpA family protein [Psychrobacter sp. AOP22-C1-22]|uniref:septal ring lytic transglycosylase RlpA family protein n=1 Tax=unclassified Psychrobacter TaxID=196806 RepID=UPI0017889E46|nr:MULTISPECIES: septal ring lytic transglycosylase RlpA family protein [unclassified Psychrobacter]MBE0406345.1 septal ring lytic transglycosylase RlpA family protein [Psychrobacter sp. FME6]MBE0444435.1 septal ring lytic transglycosylase RlpA family protein [Psychrobacter sp. FME5]MDN5801022.1 septal ring lytic transglycosylase RlpA family protein [Psychrobacter sp.]MDN5897227.1 septal ring lytic transglycosylase RlpA family protein [Psychrobacter sp.]